MGTFIFGKAGGMAALVLMGLLVLSILNSTRTDSLAHGVQAGEGAEVKIQQETDTGAELESRTENEVKIGSGGVEPHSSALAGDAQALVDLAVRLGVSPGKVEVTSGGPPSQTNRGRISQQISTQTAAAVQARAQLDLAQRLEVDPNEVHVVSVTELEMPAGGLGCPPGAKGETGPEPPGIVMGQEIVLGVNGQQHVYHAHALRLVYCGGR